MRCFLLLGCVFAAFSAGASGSRSKRSSRIEKPNILFIMADQFRNDAIRDNESSPIGTPNLARLASEGATFNSMYSSTPTCTPAREAILTGRAPWNRGMLGYGTVASKYPWEGVRALADAGYLTASVGKNHFGWNSTSNSGIAHSYNLTQLYDGLGAFSIGSANNWTGEFDNYDQWFQRQMPGKDPQATLDNLDGNGWNGWHGKAYVYDEALHPTAWTGRAADAFLRSAKDDIPWLLKVSFHRPHSPYDPPARLLDAVSKDDLPDVALAGGDAPWDLRFRGHAGDPPGCSPTPDAWCGDMPKDEAVLGRRAYLASIRFVDEQIKVIYDALKETNALERTLIFFTSDHGDGQGTHYHWRKGYPYEFSAAVPLLIRWPESMNVSVKRGVEIDKVVELRDLAHTFVDAAGLASQVRESFKAEDGKSLLCLLRDPTGRTCAYQPNPGPWRSFVDMEHSTCYNASNHWNALVGVDEDFPQEGKIKYVFRAFFGDEQLFNLTADPQESHQLAGIPEFDGTLKRWRQKLVAQFERENRGKSWVANGKLVPRQKGQTYSPFYPSNQQRACWSIALGEISFSKEC